MLTSFIAHQAPSPPPSHIIHARSATSSYPEHESQHRPRASDYWFAMARPAGRTASPHAHGHGAASPPTRPSALPGQSATSPRSSFLGSFMRTRSRAQSVTNAVAGAVRGHRVGSPTVEHPNPLNVDGGEVSRSVSSPQAGNGPSTTSQEQVVIPPVDPALRRTHRIRLVPVLETNRSFTFAPVLRKMGVMHVPPGILPSIAAASVSDPGPLVNGRPPPLILKIGRFTERTNAASSNSANGGAAATEATPGAAGAGGDAAAAASGGAANGAANGATAAPPQPASVPGGGGGDIVSARAAFKSKVVSRAHAEIWCEPGGKFYIRDTASSSGTFLNHIRLSSPNVQSRPQLLKDGDVLQLGVDYQGGTEEMYRCVKIRVEIGRDWQQRGNNEFNANAMKQLKALGGGEDASKAQASPSTARKGKASVTDCCICLFSVTVCQSLFIAPCSHVFHYKCIRPLLVQHHPGFSCPLCRTFANLEEDVETEDAWEIASRRASIISRRNSNHSIRLPTSDAASAAPRDATGDPSTGVGFGENTASIDELLAGSSEPASEEVPQSERPAVARQDTAVAHGTPGAAAAPHHGHHGNAADLIDLRSTLGADEEDDGIIAAVNAAADSVAAEDSPASASPMPIAGAHGSAGNHLATPSRDREFTLNAATPLNEVFLSTLVLQPGGSESSLSHGAEVRDSPILEEDEPPLSPDSRGSRTDFESPLQSRPTSQRPSRPNSASFPPSRSSSNPPAPRTNGHAVHGAQATNGDARPGSNAPSLAPSTPSRESGPGVPSGPVSALSGPSNGLLGLNNQLGSPLSLNSLNPSSGSSISESPFSTPMLVPGQVLHERKDAQQAVSAVSSLPGAAANPGPAQHA